MRAESAWGHSCYVRVHDAHGVRPTQCNARARGERGRHEETERRTGGSWACSWWRFNTIVEVNERVEFLERERLRRLIVNEYTLPFLRRRLNALEHYHFIVLYNTEYQYQRWGEGEGCKGRGVSGVGGKRTLTVGRSTRTEVTSLPAFTSSVPGLVGSIDAGL